MELAHAIVAVPCVSPDDPGVSEFYLGEVVSAVKTLSITFFHDGKTVEHKLTDPEIARKAQSQRPQHRPPPKDVRSSHRESPILLPWHRL